MRWLLERDPMPDVSLSSEVQELPKRELSEREMDEEYLIHYVDKYGNFVKAGGRR